MVKDIKCFHNKTTKTILLNIVSFNDYDRYNIIIKNKEKFLLDDDDFNKEFKKDIELCKQKGEIQIDGNIMSD